ncbi:MAG: hypothetical protein RMM29_02220 [Planctomycetota bacterium]|nr:hypothetical protein [Planctomycetota bacterium]MCX8040252.1 hypothetical protein [Planctomycetota bacterium]MDW8372453.1 hypothetical protein [Planctomycetota bacterium]
MTVLDPAQWEALVRAVRQACPRLTERDLAECQCRLDILVAKIQNRHWVSRRDAERLVRQLLASPTIRRSA